MNKQDFERLTERTNNLILLASQMSNVCFNLSQRVGRVLMTHDCKLMKGLQVDYDASLKEYRKLVAELATRRRHRVSADTPRET